LATQESNGCELPDSNSERALFAARYFSSGPTPWDDFEQILTNLTNKIFSVFFAGEVVGVFREKVHRRTETFFCPAKGPLGRDIFF
jgi:flavodoxin